MSNPGPAPLVTVAVPSLNQAEYLADALDSVLEQDVPVEVFVADGGSRDGSVEIIESLAARLTGWRSHADAGQAAAVNECLARGRAPYVCWLNSDDLLLPGALGALAAALQQNPAAPVAYARAWDQNQRSGRRTPVWVEPFDARRLALRCFVAQPATLIRRSAWEAVEGLDERLHMALDYDLWWRLYRQGGDFRFVDACLAVNREHGGTKTRNNRALHYLEAIEVVRRYNGRVPLKWWFYQPYAVWAKALAQQIRGD
jgi:glycosyltransferase involved in cell wall biosynthesis